MNSEITELNTGERAIENAPRLTLRNGRSCIPQHYLQYAHSRTSVEAIVSDIEFCDRYPVFIDEDAGGIILQIGVVGYDNYKSAAKQPNPKIVFGRKWRVEPNLPTSEVIQTAFLAIKKTREHEIRELFTLKISEKVTTPFNNHHDLPLMARNAEMLVLAEGKGFDIENALSTLRFDGGSFQVSDVERLRNGMTAVTLKFIPNWAGTHREFTSEPLTLLLKRPSSNTLYHALITEMISRSDNFVDETFRYRGFARFSKNVDAIAIAQLSADLRQNPETLLQGTDQACSFVKTFATERYDTDLTRIPQLTSSAYSQKLHDRLASMELSNFDMMLKAQQRTVGKA